MLNTLRDQREMSFGKKIMRAGCRFLVACAYCVRTATHQIDNATTFRGCFDLVMQ